MNFLKHPAPPPVSCEMVQPVNQKYIGEMYF